MTDCLVCCEKFDQKKKSKVKCPYCPFESCKECTRKYLLGTTSLAHCMSCKKKWERDFCQTNLNNSFYNGEYKDFRKTLLFDVEKARMAETMPAVEIYKHVEGITQKLREERKKTKELKQAYLAQKDNEYRLSRDLHRAKRGEDTTIKKKKFIKKCPADGCEGYLSTAWKCGVCNLWVCTDCEEEFGFTKDLEHTCKPDILASAKMIKKETKPCPECNRPISKNGGCNQMWCTQCQCAFNWRTGRRINGVIHNPHYVEFLRQNNNGTAPQPPGAVACGGLPTYFALRGKVRDFRQALANNDPDSFAGAPGEPRSARIQLIENLKAKRKDFDRISRQIWSMHRGAQHFQHAILDTIREKLQTNSDNKDLRIQFILGNTNEKKMKTMLMKRDTAMSKKQSMLHVYELMGTVFNESFLDIYNTIPQGGAAASRRHPTYIISDFNKLEETFRRNHDRIEKVRLYCNVELMKISILFGQIVSVILPNYITAGINKKESIHWLKHKEPGKFEFLMNATHRLPQRERLGLRNFF